MNFLTMITEGVFHGLHKVVIPLSQGVMQRHKVSQGIGRFIQRLTRVS